MNHLLVPIAVEAVMENRFNEKDKRVGKVLPQFDNLSDTILGDNIETSPFSTGEPLEAGVHLHFILPDALTHGEENSGTFRYPAIPNRWLVARIMKEESPRFSHRLWIVESDYLCTESGGIPTPTLEDQENRFKYLGRVYELDRSVPPGDSLEQLTVFCPGEATFSSYYPNCRGVLGFHDKLEDYPRGELTYLVAGWYSKAENDPLYAREREAWKQKLEALGWELAKGIEPKPDKDGKIRYPTLLHAAVCRLDWKGPDFEYPSGLPEGGITVSVGNSSTEALSALLADSMGDKTGNLEYFLNALQYNAIDLFDTIDGKARIDDVINGYRFSSLTGATRWKLRAQGTPPPLPQKALELLAQLDEYQLQKDTSELAVSSLQERLYAAWHTYLLLFEDSAGGEYPDRGAIYNEFLRLCGKLDEQAEKHAAQDADCKKAGEVLREYLKKQCLSYNLEPTPASDFYQPNSPVLLFSGKGLGRGFLYGEDGRFTENGKLRCRLPESVVTKLDVALEGGKVPLDGTVLARYRAPLSESVPEIMAALYNETLLIDPTVARALAVITYREVKRPYSERDIRALGDAISKAQLLPWSAAIHTELREQNLEAECGFTGLYPSKIAFNLWKPLWNTLFLEWRIAYFPTRSSSEKDDSMEGWSYRDGGYVYGGPPPGKGAQFSGRTVVTPHSQRILAGAIEKQLEHCDEPDTKKKLRELADNLVNLTFLSQNLSGFAGSLISLRDTYQFPLMLTSGELLNDDIAIEMTTRINRYLVNYEARPPVDTANFFPIRSGFMKIESVQLISSFGRRQVVADGLSHPVVAGSMKPPPGASLPVALPPRISQGGRLKVSWHGRESGAGSPVCGFLVPNRLERGLMVYDYDGGLLGTLSLIFREGQSFCAWQSAPLLPGQTFEETDFKSAHLRGYVGALQKTNAGLFAALLEYIDRRQSYALPESASHQQELALLAGRPLVLARAGLCLQLYGLPAYGKQIKFFADYRTGGFEDITFPVYLGDSDRHYDGSIGYFTGEDTALIYQTMYTRDGDIPPAATAYIDNKSLLALPHSGDVPSTLTLLFEPSSAVTINTGIYPGEQVRLPEAFYKEAYQRMYQSFSVHPLISPTDRISVPLPSSEGGHFSFVYRKRDGGYTQTTEIVPDSGVFTGEALHIIDGYFTREGDE